MTIVSARSLAARTLACALLAAAPAHARAQTASLFGGEYRDIETKYIFGFTDGSDIGSRGEKAIEFETNATWRKRSGAFLGLEQEIAFEHVPTQNFFYEFALHGAAHRIRDVEGLDNRNSAAFAGLSAKFRYLLLPRGPASPIGLAISAEPEWSRVEGDSGAHTRAFETTVKIAADAELIENRLYIGANLVYAPEVAKAVGDGAWARAAQWGVTGGLAYRIAPKVTLGAGAQYYRVHDSFGFRRFQGDALYAGPTLHIQFKPKVMLAAAFSTQVAGHAGADNRPLNLHDFGRHMARLKFEVEF
ncbi:MAG: hypothetical protein KGL46_13620 [Hyphomicrobiales bacterium]|nr:hypothetical protein [Hyphomicrobiales bacterium]